MRRWSEVGQRIAATTRTSEKTQLLADYLATLDRAALAPAVVFFSGRPFAESDARSLGLGWATLADMVTKVAGISRAELGAAYDRYSDMGQAVGEVLAGANADGSPARAGDGSAGDPAAGRPEPLTVPSVAAAFAAIEAARGTAPKAAIFEALLRLCDPLTATYVVKILGGELRIGLREGLVEAAIARAFGRAPAAVARAVMLTGDLGEAALLALDDRLDDARLRLFHPLRFMLASPAEDAAEIISRLGPEVWTEDKYDGIRAQLHRRGDEVRLFSRDLHDVTGQFPEVAAAARGLGGTGSSTASCSPYATVTCCRSWSCRSGSGARHPRRSSWRTCPPPSSRSTSSPSAPAAAPSRPCWTCPCASGVLDSRRSASRGPAPAKQVPPKRVPSMAPKPARPGPSRQPATRPAPPLP